MRAGGWGCDSTTNFFSKADNDAVQLCGALNEIFLKYHFETRSIGSCLYSREAEIFAEPRIAHGCNGNIAHRHAGGEAKIP
jgi:hypothetical protein